MPATPKALNDAFALYQSGDTQAALPILQSYADRDEMAAMLCAQILSAQGDATEAKRYLYNAAETLGSSDAARLLADLYVKDQNWTSALSWAERAHRGGTAAGSLFLRLSGKTGQWEKCLRLALEEVEWLTGYDRFELCEEIRTLIDGNHYSDETILELVEPILPKIQNDPVALEQLEGACQEAKDRQSADKARKEREAEQRKLQRQADQTRQEAKAEAQKRAEKAVKEAQRHQKGKERKRSAAHGLGRLLRFLVMAVAFLLLPVAACILAHRAAMVSASGLGVIVVVPLGGFLAAFACAQIIKLLKLWLYGKEFNGGLGCCWIRTLQFAILTGIIGLIGAGALSRYMEFMEAALTVMAFANCYVQEIVVLGDYSL